jgi:hypothetical protein
MMRIFKWQTETGETLEREVPLLHPRPPIKSAPLPQEHAAVMLGDLAEYAAVAAEIGFMPPDLGVEKFKAFLVQRDLPIFSLTEVVAYMDKKAAQESVHQAGWHWRPLRAKDRREGMTFGAAATVVHHGASGVSITHTPASDHYAGGLTVVQQWSGAAHEFVRDQNAAPYDRAVPLHALKKVALIEREHEGDVAFFVSDYAPRPQIRHPDPFLMAVVPNASVHIGVGRFILDFWDEPGFGVERMVK